MLVGVIGAIMLATPIRAIAASVSTIKSAELRRWELTREPDLIVVDVRPADAFTKGHIQGAKNIQPGSVAIAGLPLAAHIVVYCSEPICALSEKAANSLISAGYMKVGLLEGGFGDWLKSGYPATMGAGTKVPVGRQTMERGRDLRRGLLDGTAFALDARPANEFKAGHVAGAYNAPLEELPTHYIDLPKGKKIVVYDRIPDRAKQATAKLKTDGFDSVELAGGLAGWNKRGNKLVTK
jgi:rhodanese-related sulfurtransferase